MKEKIISEIKSLRWQNFIFLLLAGIINAFGVTVFLTPVKLYDSGISGTSMLLSQISMPSNKVQQKSQLQADIQTQKKQ